MLDLHIDEELCSQCGLCADVCILDIINLQEGLPQVSDENLCIGCQQCLAICPTGALSIMGNKAENSTPLQGNLPTPDKMATLIKGRRSFRNYKPENVNPELIRKLLDIVWHAPTGVNSQQVLATVVDNLETVQMLRQEIYERLSEAKKSGSRSDRPEMRYLGWAVRKWEEENKDIIFRGAPHFLVSSAPSTSPCPTADSHIFLSYFELMAQTMGLGTLWNGMLKWSIDTIFPDIRQRLGIPDEHEIGYVILFGNPELEYQRTVERGRAKVNFVNWK